ncbi:Siderophore iron transporter [Wickerhamomyces ciferrii]|uniref:Siderophore iron transporter n=1 Tax=Wickerhamomyces ciferrii (strain ATCC 14091 / BCRC 22168 / CBS 111 / JCM 3599 / NBRC 0793 / NRRL Y-1031 F-60-10) TaxID=1206466 RepID=K0KTA9_WICCF|nr:Siderophore iron transporter [Wickerhamomyces ciferrii]CCH44538.1 Siderophore iron transporter [Wickerhamomyces ciferrii]
MENKSNITIEDISKNETQNSEDHESNPTSNNLHSRDFQKAWSKKLIIISYIILIFTTFVESFAADSTVALSSYATSSFNNHTLISTAQVVYKITAVCGYPILAKLADLLGRGEGFGLTVSCYSLAYILFATCKNGAGYIVGEVFFAIGRIGFKLFQQVFLADTTNLLNRGIWSTLPNAISGVPSTYAGSYIQDAFLEHSTWRWAYGCFAIVLGVCVIPLTTIMIIIDHKAKAKGLRKSPKILENIDKNQPWWKSLLQILGFEIDIIGGILLVLGTALFFIPFTLTGNATPYRWSEGRLIAMIAIGFIIIIGFIIWNFSSKHKPLRNRSPFIPSQSLASRTIIVILIMTALDAMENSAFNVYFSTVLQVGGYYSAGQATRIDNAKKISIDIGSVITGILMKYTHHTKVYVFIGVPLLILGHGLLVYFMNRNGVMERTILLYMMEIFTGVGRAFYQCALQVTIQAIAGVNGIAMSTGIFFCFQIIGALIGTAIAGGIWNEILIKKLNKYLPLEERKNTTKIFKSIKVAMSYEKGSIERDAISLSYRETIQIIGYVALGLIGPMLILMFFVKEVKLDEKRDVYSSDEEEISENKNE